ncbi:MAG TPA: aminotransferase class IV [Solirubrobacterales bacterium]|nr:aminotransferase class IV [Solirubrobacterales bacterium]
MSHRAPATQSPRPDARDGIFETILIFEDRPVELDAHLVRLAASVHALYGEDPPDTRELVLANARGGWLGRMRLTVEPLLRGGLDASVLVAPFDPNNVFPTGDFASKLVTLPVDRGYGEHKWADRAMLSRAEAEAGPGAAPLLVREDGTVLEGSRANTFVVRGRTVSTPPLDGEILPGVARAGLIEVAEEYGIEVVEEHFDLEALLAADEVFLTNSLRGVEPVRAIDGEPIPSEGPITQALAAGLRQRWFGPWT